MATPMTCNSSTSSLSLVIATIGLLAIVISGPHGRRKTRTSEQCAIFSASDADILLSGEPSYIEIGNVDTSDTFDLSMEVMPNKFNHNGILFSSGFKPDFAYFDNYERDEDRQFIVVEFIYSALSLTVKALGTKHLKMIEIIKVGTTTYSLSDARWHNINVTRQDGRWSVMIDDKEKNETISKETNVQLLDKPAFIGGRPGYLYHQFAGVIRRVRVNGQSIQLAERETIGEAEVIPCSSEDARNFIAELKTETYTAPQRPFRGETSHHK